MMITRSLVFRDATPLIVLLLLIFIQKGISDNGEWSNRYMKWKKNDTNRSYSLYLCASRNNVVQCGKFRWTFQFDGTDTDHTCYSLFDCTNTTVANFSQYMDIPAGANVPAESCRDKKLQFYRNWNNKMRRCCPTVEKMARSPTKYYATASESIAQTTRIRNDDTKSVKHSEAMLATLVGILVVLLTVVTIGWVYTCWTLKKTTREKTFPIQRYNINVQW